MLTETLSDRNLALEATRVTEAAALAAARFMGQGDEKSADEAAVEATQSALAGMMFDGTVRIGEGAQGEAERLFVGQKVGSGDGTKADVAIVPLEGKSIVARGGPNALSVVAMSEGGGILSMPNIYMDKIAVGPGLPTGIVDLDAEPADNLKAVAEAKGIAIGELVVCILDRPRHSQLIAKVRDAGACIRLILDGDVAGVVSTAIAKGGVDIFLGIGGAPQGVLAAAAMRAAGGQMQGRLVMRNGDDRVAAADAGIEDPERKLDAADMAAGNVTFAATGVTYGAMLDGVRFVSNGAITQSLVLRSVTGTIRYIEGHHDFSRRAGST